MPKYEYRCPICDTEIEVEQKMSAPDPDCEKCLTVRKKEVKMIKQISLGNFVLKGGNWFKDGYSGKKK